MGLVILSMLKQNLRITVLSPTQTEPEPFVDSKKLPGTAYQGHGLVSLVFSCHRCLLDVGPAFC